MDWSGRRTILLLLSAGALVGRLYVQLQAPVFAPALRTVERWVQPPSATPRPTRTPTPVPTLTSTPAPTPTPVPPVSALRTYPVDGDTDVLPQAPVQIVFNQPMDTSAGTVTVTVSPSLPVQAEWPASDTLLLRTEPWAPNTEYRMTLVAARSRQGSPLAQPLVLTFRRGGNGTPLPMLMYHYVKTLGPGATAVELDCTVTREAFAAQMDLLLQLGAHVVPLGEAVDYLTTGKPLPARPVVLTFDDGYEDVYRTAAPIMQARRMTATIFIAPCYIGTRPYMSWAELQSLAAAGFTLGAHGYDHKSIRNLAAAAVDHQLTDGRRWIEEMTGAKVLFFAYPYGDFSAEACEQVAARGYRAALAIGPHTYQRLSYLMALPRIHVTYGDAVQVLRDKLPWK